MKSMRSVLQLGRGRVEVKLRVGLERWLELKMALGRVELVPKCWTFILAVGSFFSGAVVVNHAL